MHSANVCTTPHVSYSVLLQVQLFNLKIPSCPPQRQLLPSIEREVAGLLGSQVYPGKRIPAFADSQPMLITSLLLNAAACYLRDPAVSNDPTLAPRNTLHLAAAAITLQPRFSKAYHRAACALGKLGGADLESLEAAHAIMRYAAQLEGRPAAELLAQLPPLCRRDAFWWPRGWSYRQDDFCDV
jgi:hypothetical protein